MPVSRTNLGPSTVSTNTNLKNPIRDTEGTEEAEAGKEITEAGGTEKQIYCVQTGAYAVKANAEAMRDKLVKAGFEAVIVKK